MTGRNLVLRLRQCMKGSISYPSQAPPIRVITIRNIKQRHSTFDSKEANERKKHEMDAKKTVFS